jgi:hypothetical protein
LRQVAALKKFGLLEEEGSRDDRQLKLSDLALDIVTPGSPRRTEALQTAALKPAIHQELRKLYPDGLPSDETVRFYLERERNFIGRAANELLKEYRATMQFAGLEDSSESGDTVGDSDDPDPENGVSQEDKLDESIATVEREEIIDPASGSGSTLRSIVLPLSETAWVTVKGEFPLSEPAWDQMLGMLAAMKPGLTRVGDDED